MLELKHKQHAENFNNINILQIKGDLITKNYGPKIYPMFLNCCFLNIIINRPTRLTPDSEKIEKYSCNGCQIRLETYYEWCLIIWIVFLSRFENHFS